jgi:aldehyde dehydrogenase family 7 protein A1
LDGLEDIKKHGGKILCGGELVNFEGGNFVKPTIVEVDPSNPMLQHELFVPILYVMKFKTLEQVI